MDLMWKLAELLASPPSTIDIIPGDGKEWLESYPNNKHSPFLFVQGNLGVPDKVLYKAYLMAVKYLREPKSCLERLGQTSNAQPNREDAMTVTSVILLANPAHQAALNIRKTILSHLDSLCEATSACKAELEFVAALLSVKQCAKVSILWHHRWALLVNLYRISTDEEIADGLQSFFTRCSVQDLHATRLQAEFDLASRASKIYPRNYFAWYHRLLSFRTGLQHYVRVRTFLKCASQGKLTHAPDNPSREEIRHREFALRDFEKVLSSELANAKLWIERHVSDYSAVDYACKIYEELDGKSADIGLPLQASQLQDQEACLRRRKELASHALKLVQSYPSHEALWLYVRRTTQMLINIGEHPSAAQLLEETDSFARKTIADATRKCQSRPEGATDVIRHEAHTMSRHVLLFLLARRRFHPMLHSNIPLPDQAGDNYKLLSLACKHYNFGKTPDLRELWLEYRLTDCDILRHILSVA